MAHSSDGVNWMAVANTPFKEQIFRAPIAFGNGKFVAAHGNRPKTAYSSDGIWTGISNPCCIFFAITYGNDKFVAGGLDGVMAYSTGL